MPAFIAFEQDVLGETTTKVQVRQENDVKAKPFGLVDGHDVNRPGGTGLPNRQPFQCQAPVAQRQARPSTISQLVHLPQAVACVVVRKEFRQLRAPSARDFTGTDSDYLLAPVLPDAADEIIRGSFERLNQDFPKRGELAAKRQAAEATDKGFVAVAGYEHSENNGPNGTGHLNVINSSQYLNALAPGMDLPTFYHWLKTTSANGEGAVVASFNHPGARGYNNWAGCDAQVADIITLLEVINSNNKIHYPAFVNALDRGWKVSPVCGNDNHGFWGISHHTSRTFVLATAKTKAAILDAMKHRRTYASLEGNLHCRYTVNGEAMGSTLKGPDHFQFEIGIEDPDTDKAEDRITQIDIVKDGGSVVQEYRPTPAHSVRWSPAVQDATNKFFFVRVWNAGGGDAPGAKPANPVAWLAPVWTGR